MNLNRHAARKVIGILPLSALLGTAGHAHAPANPASPAAPAVPANTLPSATRLGLSLVTRAEEEVLLFALNYEGRLLSDTLPVYRSGDGYVVPLGELSRLLGLAIRIDAARGVASGFVIRESRRFSLDLLGGVVELDGKRHPVERTRLELHRDDIFVDTRELAQWFALRFEIDTFSSLMALKAQEKMPVALRWEREDRGRRYRSDFTPAESKATPVADPWRIADAPMVDQTLALSTTPSRTEGGRREFRVQSSTYLAGDLLWMTASGFAHYDDQRGWQGNRFSLGRWDPSGGQLGVLKAKEFALGTVFSPGMNLVASPTQGTGLLVSNFNLGLDATFDRHTFRGNLPPGWSVELYQNQALIAFQGGREDGLYEFLSVPMRFGLNDFRLVFYGPEGQRREEVHRFDVSQSQTPQGEFRYRLVGLRPTDKDVRTFLETSYGITEHFSGSLGLSRLTLSPTSTAAAPETKRYAQAGLQAFSSLLSGSLDLVADEKGGSMAEVALRTGSDSRHGLVLKRSELRDFTSEIFQGSRGSIRNRTALATYTSLPLSTFTTLQVFADAARDELVAGGTLNRQTLGLSSAVGRLFLSNTVTWTQDRGAGLNPASATRGTFMISRFFPAFSFRGQADYSLKADRRLETLTLITETQHFYPFMVTGTVGKNLQAGASTFGLSVNKFTGKVGLGLRADYNTQLGFSAAVTLQIGLGREPRSGRWHAQARPAAFQGAVSGRAFLDANGNGVFDAGERLVKGVGVAVNGGARPAEDENAEVAFVRDIFPAEKVFVSIDPRSLDDPNLRSTRGLLRIKPRAGRVLPLDLPLVVHGEIDGTVYVKDDHGTVPCPGIEIQVVDPSGKVVLALPSAYDGYYYLSDLPPGAYIVRVNPTQAEGLGLVAPAPVSIKLEATGTVLNGRTIVLERAAPRKESAGAEPAS